MELMVKTGREETFTVVHAVPTHPFISVTARVKDAVVSGQATVVVVVVVLR
jgi:hypothetical protein